MDENKVIEFQHFKDTIEKGIRGGEIKFVGTGCITEFDMAVQFAIGKIGERKQYPMYVTPEEIYFEIGSFTDPDNLSCEGWFYESVQRMDA